MIFGNAIKCFMGTDRESGRNRHLSCEIRGRQAGWDMPMLKVQHAFSKDLLTNDRRKFNISSVVPVARVCLGRGESDTRSPIDIGYRLRYILYL